MLISKELLSEVLEVEVTHIGTVMEHNSSLQYSTENREHHFSFNAHINIHELAHKCKEWAYHLKESCNIVVHHDHSGVYNAEVGLPIYKEQQSEWFKADTEPEAIFKACEWIRENR